LANAYVNDENSIKLPRDVSDKLKLKKGMELQVLCDDDGTIILKVLQKKDRDFSGIAGIGKDIWKNTEAQDYVDKERSGWN